MVVVYTSTEAAPDHDKDEFYQQLSSVFDELPRHDLLVERGEFKRRDPNSDANTLTGRSILG